MVVWLCFTSHRQQGHLEMATPFNTVPCKGHESQFLHRSHWELNPGPSRGSPLHYRCATPGYRFTKNRMSASTCRIYDTCKSTFACVSKSLSINFDSGRTRTQTNVDAFNKIYELICLIRSPKSSSYRFTCSSIYLRLRFYVKRSFQVTHALRRRAHVRFFVKRCPALQSDNFKVGALKVVVTAGASMQIYIFFSLYSIYLSIRDKFSHF